MEMLRAALALGGSPMESTAHARAMLIAADRSDMYAFYHVCLTLPLTLLLALHVGGQTGEGCGAATLGSHCFSGSADWLSDGTCIKFKELYTCHVPDTRNFKFTLRISIRQLRLGANSRPLDKLWIRGSGPGLSWKKPILLQKSAKGIGLYETNIIYKYDSQGRLCVKNTHCLFNQKSLELRVYQDKGGTYDMIGPNLYTNLPISHSMFGHQHFITPYADIHPWFGGKAITIEELTLSNLPLPFSDVTLELLYPPSFDYNVRKKYPVVILFGTGEGLRISPLLETMYVHEASIREAFIINIHSSDSAPFCAFNPYSKANAGTVNSIWKCKDKEQCKIFNFCWYSKCDKEAFIDGTQRYLHSVKCGGMGEVMLDIIENHVLPEVKSKVQNRLLLDFPKDRMSIIGHDGAGLLACHAAISRPYFYQNAACMSAPFHWPLNVQLNRDAQVNDTGISQTMSNVSKEFLYYPDKRFFHTTQKYYIDYGEMDNHHFPLIEMARYIDWFVNKLQVEFSVPSQNILQFTNILKSSNNYFLRTDGGTEILNRVRLPLLFFLQAEGGPNTRFPLLTKPVNTTNSGVKMDETIPEECIREIQILQQKTKTASKDIPVEVLGLSISKVFRLRSGYTSGSWTHLDVYIWCSLNCKSIAPAQFRKLLLDFKS